MVEVELSGDSRKWSRKGDEGSVAHFHFCPNCGSNVYYIAESQPDLIAVAVGAFADPDFPSPEYAVYRDRKHSWVTLEGDDLYRYD